jgi:serine/threonine protein kinase
MTTPFLDLQANPIPRENIIGSGSSALVLLQDDVAVKIPLKCLWSDTYEVQANIQKLRHEQNVYHRLQGLPCNDNRSDGVVRCLGMFSESTQLAYMSNGDLQSYLKKSQPSLQLQFLWCLEIARTLTFIHDRCILVTDIASRNFLLDSDFSIKFCDFSEASILPLGSDMKAVNDHGFNTQIDIGLLGTVMYEIVTGEKLRVDLFKDNSPTDGRAYWPKREILPKTTDIWLGWIIEGCWDGKFQTAHCVLQAFDNVRLPPVSQSISIRLGQAIKNSITSYRVFTVFGLIGLTLFLGRRAVLQS